MKRTVRILIILLIIALGALYFAVQREDRLNITIYPGATLFKPRDAYDACVTGIADIAWGFIGLFHSRFPLTDLVTLPLLGIKDARMGSLLSWHLYEKFPAIRNEFKDVKLLVLHTHRGGVFGTSKPVRAIKDFKGLIVFLILINRFLGPGIEPRTRR